MVKYSYVIPTYKNKVFLRNTLEALNYQEDSEEGEFEAVVVDDGSSDDTWEYIKDVNKTYPIKYIYLPRSENSCRSRTRNYGWKAAEGEIIIFIDADIIVKRNHLKEVKRCYAFNKDIAIIGLRKNLQEDITNESVKDGSVYEIYEQAENKIPYLEDRDYAYNKLSYNLNMHRFPWLLVFSCNLVVRKSHLEEIGGFDEGFKSWGAEDLDVGYRLFKKGYRLISDYRLLGFHQYHISCNNGTDKANNDYFFSKYEENLMEGVREGWEFILYAPSIGISKSDDMTFTRIFRKYQLRRKNPHVLEVRSEEDAESVKAYLRELPEDNSKQIQVNDYYEASDLDLWIQFLDKENCLIEYYPMSRERTREIVQKQTVR